MKQGLTILALSGLAILGSCKGSGESGPEKKTDVQISVNPTSLILDADQTESRFSLTSSADWDLSTGTEWIKSINPSSGKGSENAVQIVVTTSANDGALRSGTITISASGETRTITVSQSEAAGKAVFGQAYLMKAELVENSAGFNMLSDPSFEDYPEKNLGEHSPWWAASSERVKSGAQSGDCYCRLSESIDENLAFQTVCTKPNTEYELSAWFLSNKDKENPDLYMGLRVGTGTRPVNKDVKFGETFSTSWVKCSMTADSKNNAISEAFAFSFHKDGYILAWDNVCLKRAGDTQKSYYLTNVQKVSSLLGKTDGAVTSTDGITVWDGGNGKAMIAFGQNVGDLENATKANAIGSSTDWNSIDVALKDNKVAEILPAGSNEAGILPTAGVFAGGKQWIHYQIIREKEFASQVWRTYGAGLAYSADGKEWTRSDNVTFDKSGNFVEAAFLKDGGYVYMYGSHVGRGNQENIPVADEHYVTVARCPEAEIGTMASWKFWNGAQWVADEVNAAPIIYAGTLGELSVIKNSTTGRYFMIYSSIKRNAIVIRDAGSPEGDWSGESIVMSDTSDEVLYAPSFCPVSANGNEVYFVVNSAWGK